MLNADELKQGPGPRLAFLGSLDAQILAEIMVSFANTEGGIIVLGLDANGQPSAGTISAEGVQKVLESAENLFNPGIVIEAWQVLTIEDDYFFDEAALGRVIIPANPVSKSAEGVPAATPSPTLISDSMTRVGTPPLESAATPTQEASTNGVDVSVTPQPPPLQATDTALTADSSALKPAETPVVATPIVSETPAPASTASETAASVLPAPAPDQTAASAAPAPDETPAIDTLLPQAASAAAPVAITPVPETPAPETPAATALSEISAAIAPAPSDTPTATEALAETPAVTPPAASDTLAAMAALAEVSPTITPSSGDETPLSTPDLPTTLIPESKAVDSALPQAATSPTKSEALAADRADAPVSAIESAPASVPSQAEIKPIVPVTPAAPAIPKPQPVLYGVRIPRSIELHALNDGRVLIRSGARNRPLGGQEILRLASSKGTGEFEAEIVPGATQADFSRRMIDEYLVKRAERTKRPFSGSIDDMLLEIGALNSDRRPTTAGILLFSEYPQKWLPQSSLIFARFVGTQPRGESGMAGYIRREEITGPLPRMIEAAWNLVWSEMAVSAMVSGLEREEKAEYPQFAVREAIVNSICHRDYRLRGRRIELRMYSDRLEVISPGGLPGFITVENIKDEHFSRNPRIVNGLFQWGYIEELGLGIDRMFEVMEQAGREPPHFDARPYSFAVTLNNEREKQRPLDWIRSANHRQARAMQYIREHGSITNREYRILCVGVSAETLRLDLSGMVDRGQLIKVGSKKGTHYILRDKDAPEIGAP